MKEYAVISEEAVTGWSAYAPHLPGLGIAGTTYSETEELMRNGIEFHIESLRADGGPVPESTPRVTTLPISA